MPAVRQHRQKFFFAGGTIGHHCEAVVGMVGQRGRKAGEHVTVVDPGIVAVAFAGDQQAEMDGRRTAAPLCSLATRRLESFSIEPPTCLGSPQFAYYWSNGFRRRVSDGNSPKQSL
jgi:hypothetical protein